MNLQAALPQLILYVHVTVTIRSKPSRASGFRHPEVVAHGISRRTPPGSESQLESQDQANLDKHTHTQREMSTASHERTKSFQVSDYSPGNRAALKPPIIIAACWLADN